MRMNLRSRHLAMTGKYITLRRLRNITIPESSRLVARIICKGRFQIVPRSLDSGPSDEDEFSLSLFRTPSLLRNVESEVQLVEKEDVFGQPSHIATDDNQCACE
jgi:hypothetical protein